MVCDEDGEEGEGGEGSKAGTVEDRAKYLVARSFGVVRYEDLKIGSSRFLDMHYNHLLRLDTHSVEFKILFYFIFIFEKRGTLKQVEMTSMFIKERTLSQSLMMEQEFELKI